MKLTEKKIKQLIKEAMEEREFDFSGMISKGLDYEGLRSMIELMLDAEEVKYRRAIADDDGNRKRTYYIFDQQPYGSYYWYQPFDALVKAFDEAEIPNESEMRLMTKITVPSFRTINRRDKRTVVIYNNSPKKS